MSVPKAVYRPTPVPLPEDSEELVQLALTAYNEGRADSLRQAAREHNANRETVRKRFDGREIRKKAHQSQQILTQDEESTLSKWCLQYHSWGYPSRIDILIDMAEAIRRRRHKDENRSTPLQPIGKNWYKRFLGRHAELKLIYGRKLDHSRAMNNNPKIIQEFFDLYKRVLNEYNITSDRTFNMDEKGFLLGLAKSAKVIVHASKKYNFVTQDGGRETVTVLEGVSARGFICPPLIIYKGAYHQRGWHQDSQLVPGNWRFSYSPTGWTNGFLCLDWLKNNFDTPTRHLLTSPSQYRLLLLDGHESHINWEFIQYCLANKIVALCLPPHSTHLLQPLDVGIFSPFNHYYGREVDNMVRLGITGIGKPLFLQLFMKAREKTMQQRTIKNAFVEAGLVPYSPTKVLKKLPNYEKASPSSTSSSTQSQPNNSSPSPVQQDRPSTPRKSKDVQNHLKHIFHDLETQSPDELSSPSKLRIQQLGNAVERYIAENAILIEVNTKLRNANHMRRKQDQRVLSKTRVLSAEEAQNLKRKAEEKDTEMERKKKKKKGTRSESFILQQSPPPSRTYTQRIETPTPGSGTEPLEHIFQIAIPSFLGSVAQPPPLQFVDNTQATTSSTKALGGLGGLGSTSDSKGGMEGSGLGSLGNPIDSRGRMEGSGQGLAPGWVRDWEFVNIFVTDMD